MTFSSPTLTQQPKVYNKEVAPIVINLWLYSDSEYSQLSETIKQAYESSLIFTIKGSCLDVVGSISYTEPILPAFI